MALNTLGKRNWLLIGGLIILSAGMIGACTYPTKTSTTPVMETGPVVAKPEEGISGETISPEPESETAPTSQPSQAKESEEITGEECYKDPRQALDKFLAYLHNGHYEKAAGLYAGNYPFERAHISPDQMKLKERINFIANFLEDFCRGYGTCLEHRIVSEKVLSEDTVLFGVQFLEENRELFELVVPPVAPEGVDKSVATEFGLRVVEIDDCYRSVDVPPITP